MSFVAKETIPATPETPVTIKNDGWYPDVDLSDFRDAMRLDGTVTTPRLKQAVVDAIISVNRALATWKSGYVTAGIAKLADIQADEVNEERILLSKYRRAVYCLAKADLIERYRDFDATGDGNKQADALESSSDEMRRNAHWALADMLGQARMTIELI